MANDKAFLAFWALLEAGFGAQGNEPDARARRSLFRSRFNDCDDKDLIQAGRRCVDELYRFPTVRDVLDRLPGRLIPVDEAEAAWTCVLASVANGPHSYNPHTGTHPTGEDLDDRCLAAIGGRAGLRRLQEAEGQEQGFIRRDFLAAYQAHGRMGAAGLLPDGKPVAKPKALRGGAPRSLGEALGGGE